MEDWSNYACLGYIIKALESLNYPEEDIKNIVKEMKYLFDMKSINEASKIYCDSKY